MSGNKKIIKKSRAVKFRIYLLPANLNLSNCSDSQRHEKNDAFQLYINVNSNNLNRWKPENKGKEFPKIFGLKIANRNVQNDPFFY